VVLSNRRSSQLPSPQRLAGKGCVRMPALGAVSSLATSGAVGVASDLTRTPDDRSRMLPVHAALSGLFPRGGLRRGGTVAVRGSTSLLFALLAEATATGSWAALVGMPNLGLRAAAELGVAVDRLALVRHPGAGLPRVVAALLDGMDLVAVDPARLTDSQIHRLSARARHRGTVLVSTGPWPGADLELTQDTAAWSGLGDGHGHLVERAVRVGVRGRGAATRATETRLYLPAEGGTVRTPTDSFGALGTDRLSPPEVDAPKDPFVPVPRGEAPGGTKLTVLNDEAEEPAGPPGPAGPSVSPPSVSPPSGSPLSGSPASLSSRPISLSLAPPLPASPSTSSPSTSSPPTSSSAASVPPTSPTSPAVARLAASLGPASPACGFAFEQDDPADDPADDTVLAGRGA
jgi:hypothetical protein